METTSVDSSRDLARLMARLRVIPAPDPAELGYLNCPSSPENMWG